MLKTAECLTTEQRNVAIDEVIKSQDTDFMVIMKPGIEFKQDLPVILQKLVDIVSGSRYSYLVALPGELDRPILASTENTVATLTCPDGFVLLTKTAVESVGYFNAKLDGELQMQEYLARVNRMAGICPEFFVCIANSQQYFSFSIPPAQDAAMFEKYNKCIERINKGYDLRIKRK